MSEGKEISACDYSHPELTPEGVSNKRSEAPLPQQFEYIPSPGILPHDDDEEDSIEDEIETVGSCKAFEYPIKKIKFTD